jgi:lysophospholipase L1-like esterase
MFCDYHNLSGQDMDDLMLDGTHPNDKGHEMIADQLVKEIMRK